MAIQASFVAYACTSMNFLVSPKDMDPIGAMFGSQCPVLGAIGPLFGNGVGMDELMWIVDFPLQSKEVELVAMQVLQVQPQPQGSAVRLHHGMLPSTPARRCHLKVEVVHAEFPTWNCIDLRGGAGVIPDGHDVATRSSREQLAPFGVEAILRVEIPTLGSSLVVGSHGWPISYDW